MNDMDGDLLIRRSHFLSHNDRYTIPLLLKGRRRLGAAQSRQRYQWRENQDWFWLISCHFLVLIAVGHAFAAPVGTALEALGCFQYALKAAMA